MRQVGGLASALQEELHIATAVGEARRHGSLGMSAPVLRSKAPIGGFSGQSSASSPRVKCGSLRQTLDGKPQRKRGGAELGRPARDSCAHSRVKLRVKCILLATSSCRNGLTSIRLICRVPQARQPLMQRRRGLALSGAATV
jgi:hypothetical protein